MTEKRDGELTAVELYERLVAENAGRCDRTSAEQRAVDIERCDRILAAGREQQAAIDEETYQKRREAHFQQGEERGKLVPCPTCEGDGLEGEGPLGIVDPETGEGHACPDCHGSGKLRRELAAVLEACDYGASIYEPANDSLTVFDCVRAWAREKWG